MHDRLQAIHHQFQKLESKRQEVELLLQSLSPKEYGQQPAPETWSIGQVANHVYLSERNSLAYLKKKLSYPDSVPQYHPKSWGGILLIKLVFFTHFKIKAPESIDTSKIENLLPYDELKIKWETLRQELISFIEKNDSAFGRHLAFRHPFAGRMTMHQMLIFMNDHLRHHQHQMKRLLKQLA
jgi:uncharacterized damage-inducible protein DinB